MRTRKFMKLMLTILSFVVITSSFTVAQTYKIVDTGQKTFYDNTNTISEPSSSDSFYGQDAQIDGNQPGYKDNGDGTVTDLVTGLTWQKTADLNGDGKIDYNDKLTYDEAVAAADTFSLGGYND